MNLKRFTGRTSREALALVRQTFGADAVVMSTRPCAEGVEVLAMAPESMQQIERLGANISTAVANSNAPTASTDSVQADVQQMQMSTLSFQDYVRNRMLKRRRNEMAAVAPVEPMLNAAPPQPTALQLRRTPESPPSPALQPTPQLTAPAPREDIRMPLPLPTPPRTAQAVQAPQAQRTTPPLADMAPRREQNEMLSELRSMRGLIEQRFGALAFMEKLQRQPRHATLTQRLLECGFSPSLIRRLGDSLPAEGDEMAWATQVLERNLATGEHGLALEESGGIYALIGSTGVGKTTSTAKLAAAFAAQHGAAQLGLVTLDAYRVGAQEQLRTYGRILGVPVHTAHDRASLEDLLDLLAAKKMVLIDTAGMAQRDSRTSELLEMLSHRSVKRLLVMNAAAQGETFEDVLGAYSAATCSGVILSKLDEAVKLGPALDALIRHKLKVVAVANGQRVPEDWHRLSSSALVQRALRSGGSPAWRHDAGEMNLVFAAMPLAANSSAGAAHAVTA